MKKQIRFGMLFTSLVLLCGWNGLQGQDPAKKGEPEKEKKEETKAKGVLPTYWREIGLSDNQKQEVYKIQNKYNEEIDKLELRIKELKTKMSDERFKVLTPEQKKNLEAIIKAKAGTPPSK